MNKRHLTVACALLILIVSPAAAAEPFSAADALNLKRVTTVDLSPDGAWAAYTVSVPRSADEDSGSPWSELHLVSTSTGQTRRFVTGKVNVGSPQWSPDGKFIAFTMARVKDAKTQVWLIPMDGGEAFELTSSRSSVLSFRWDPAGKRIAYVAVTPQTAREKDLEKKGYGFTFYEENLKDRNLYVADVDTSGKAGEATQLTQGISVWSFEWSNNGNSIAAAISPQNLVDHNYMFQKIHILDVATKKLRRLVDNPGKLGNFAWSPDDRLIAYSAAIDQRDHAASQVLVVDVGTGEVRNLTEPKFRGHVEWVGWQDQTSVLYRAAEGVWPTLSTVPAKGGVRTIILHAKNSGIIFGTPSSTWGFQSIAFAATAPDVPSDAYFWQPGLNGPKRLSNINPWIAERVLARQEVIRYKARDGVEIEGILYYPTAYAKGKRYPLIVDVHGGPESNHSNGWHTNYVVPPQVLAGKGYLVFLPNYGASTGYGLEFALRGYQDAAGKEFDDIADGIDYLVSTGLADPARVGLGGGSYGGFAAAWFATYYTAKVRAVFMFVGISDLTSKRLTTDIPYEELYVHSGKALEDGWDFSLNRSPIRYAKQSKTAVLIAGGSADPRVHPSQSLEFYRVLKLNGHPAVRLVQYPGEGHGNTMQPGRTDLLYRHVAWFDWYVRDLKPIDGPMPPLDISDVYGLKNLEN
jgi:dipeptidyl aminopeptidase/acylaminoacyl peptidase